MLSLSQLKKETQSLSLPVGLTFAYRPYAVTPEMESRLEEETAGAKPVLIRTLAELIATWNLKADAGDKEPLPVTEDTLMLVPGRLLKDILKAIAEDMQPPLTPDGGSF